MSASKRGYSADLMPRPNFEYRSAANMVNSSWLTPISTGTRAARPAANAATGPSGNNAVPVTGPESASESPMKTYQGGRSSAVAGSARRHAAVLAGLRHPVDAAEPRVGG